MFLETLINGFFYASAPKVPEALCFRVVRPSGFFRLHDNSSITWWNFIKLGTGVHHQECTTRSRWTDYLMEFHQTWYRGAPTKVLYKLLFSRGFYFREFREPDPLHFMSIYSNDNIIKIAKLTTRELPQKSKNAKITVRENNGLYKMNWLDFGRDPPTVKGQRSMNLVSIIVFTSF